MLHLLRRPSFFFLHHYGFPASWVSAKDYLIFQFSMKLQINFSLTLVFFFYNFTLVKVDNYIKFYLGFCFLHFKCHVHLLGCNRLIFLRAVHASFFAVTSHIGVKFQNLPWLLKASFQIALVQLLMLKEWCNAQIVGKLRKGIGSMQVALTACQMLVQMSGDMMRTSTILVIRKR